VDAYLDFEKPIVSLEKKIEDLNEISKSQGVDLAAEISTLRAKVEALVTEIYGHLTPWQRVQVSRHPNRPYFRDYVQALFPDFLELQGDRCFADDRALVGGTATLSLKGSAWMPVMILGQQKGRSTRERLEQNFGMSKPEGYRKAIRLMELANRSKMPVIQFIDTPGAYPGIETEERGQAQAIAECIRTGFSLDVPMISIVIGEGGSGGALAIGVANKVLMLEYATYSVISPEACASILWSDASLSERAAVGLKMTPTDLMGLGVIDGIISEPVGGAHRDWPGVFARVHEAL
jgi:acetyl-CoA carboxylase carboxyl transferase subunit alpha